jgi:hypothetical protein
MSSPKRADTRYLEPKNGEYMVTVAGLHGKLGTKLKRRLQNADCRATANTLKCAVFAELKVIIDRVTSLTGLPDPRGA